MQNTATSNEIFIVGLQNAHAMEHQALAIIKPKLARLENYPKVSHLPERHQREIETLLQLIDEILETDDEGSSGLKDMMMPLSGTRTPRRLVKSSRTRWPILPSNTSRSQPTRRC